MIKVNLQKLETLEQLLSLYDMKKIKVEGHPELNRDSSSGAIINTSQSDYDNYMKLAKMRQNERYKMNNIEKDLSNLKQEINEIKNLLINLSNNKT